MNHKISDTAIKELNLPNMTLIALVASCLLQFGAQLFALSVVASTVAEAPPRSFAMLDGKYGYNSSAFWNTVPMITFVLFIIGGLVAGFYLEPAFADMIKRGYSDQVDPVLQNQAKRWYYFDWTVWALGLFAGLALLIALVRPVRIQVRDAGDGKD